MTLPPPLAGVRRALFVHAHPDDESLATGGLIALLVAQGVAVSLVTCTRGERGEVVPGPLTPLQGTAQLAPHRVSELAGACAALGIADRLFLGEPGARAARLPPRCYADSGMQWGPDGRAIAVDDSGPDAFTRAPFVEALADLLTVIDLRRADTRAPELVVSYDELGGYGHPDHRRAARLAREAAAARGIRYLAVPAVESERPGDLRLDITPVLAIKRAALAAHATQLTLTADGYVLSGGQEHVLPHYELLRPEECPKERSERAER